MGYKLPPHPLLLNCAYSGSKHFSENRDEAWRCGVKRRDRTGARKGWGLGDLGPICASFEGFGGEIEGFSNGDGTVLRQNERPILCNVR